MACHLKLNSNNPGFFSLVLSVLQIGCTKTSGFFILPPDHTHFPGSGICILPITGKFLCHVLVKCAFVPLTATSLAQTTEAAQKCNGAGYKCFCQHTGHPCGYTSWFFYQIYSFNFLQREETQEVLQVDV